MRLKLLLLTTLLAPCVARTQSQPDPAPRPAILGTLDKGKYSNPVIGFELQIDPTCAFAEEARAIAFSTRFPQRLSSLFRCGDNLVLVGSTPLYSDEEVDLRRDAEPSLLGTLDAGGFKKRGGWQSQTAGGTEVLVQEIVREGKSGPELGFYRAFMVGRRYVSVLTIGPESNKAELSQIGTKLKIGTKPAE